jgi:multiple sugar transport system substrate-binding protein
MSKMSIKSMVSLVVFVMLVVSGCSTEQAGKENGQNSNEVKTVRFSTNETDPPSVEFYNKVIKEYEVAHPNIKISLELMTADDLTTKLAASVVAGSPPEIAQINPENVAEYQKAGYLLQIDDVVDAIGRDEFTQGSIMNIEGHDYAIPYAGSGTVMWVRKDLFEKNNIKMPTNWEELLDASRKLTMDTNNDGKTDIYGIALPYGENPWTHSVFSMFMWQNGQTLFDKDLKPTFNTPATIEALKFYKELSKSTPPDAGSYSFYETINAYLSGKVAMAPYMGRMLSQLGNNNPALLKDTVAILMPGKKLSVNYGGWNVYSVFKSAKNAEEGKKFLEYLESPKILSQFLLTVPGHLVPPTKSILNSQDFWANQFVKDNEANIKKVFDASANSALAPISDAGAIVDGKIDKSNIIFNPYIGTIFSRNIVPITVQKVLLQNQSEEEAAAWAQQQIEAIIQEKKAK